MPEQTDETADEAENHSAAQSDQEQGDTREGPVIADKPEDALSAAWRQTMICIGSEW